MKQLTIIVTDTEADEDVTWMDHVEVNKAHIEYYNPWQEIESNPAMAAALAGAPVDAWKALPGRQVASMHDGTEVTITYEIRLRLPNATITEFRAVP